MGGTSEDWLRGCPRMLPYARFEKVGSVQRMACFDRSRLRMRFVSVLALAGAFLTALGGVDSVPDRGPATPGPDQRRVPFASLGTKVGEVRPTSALIHGYLLQRPADELLLEPYAERKYRGQPGSVLLEYGSSPQMEEFPPLVSWKEFERYRVNRAANDFTAWHRVPQNHSLLVNPNHPSEAERMREAQASDYSVRVRLESLHPETQYYFRMWIRGEDTEQVRAGRVHQFTTAPNREGFQDVSFLAATCFHHGKMKDLREGVWPVEGFRMYRAILDRVKAGQLSFDFAVINGDAVYLDKQGNHYRTRPAHAAAGMRARFFDTYLTPLARDFFARFPAYFLKDDHDWRFNDADPVFNAAASPGRSYLDVRKYYRGPPGPYLGKQIFEELHPLERGARSTPYRTFRWGKGLQIWLLESRECRYPNARQLGRYRIRGLVPPRENPRGPFLYYPDYCGVPSQEDFWGEKQFSWLLEGLKKSDAHFKIIISPTPVLGPDQKIYAQVGLNPFRRKQDNHVVRFRLEFSRFLRALEAEKLRNIYFVSGDRHFLWHSRYQTREGEFSLHEFGPGPFTDDVVAFGKMLYEDERGGAQVVATLGSSGFLHVQVKNVAVQPRLHVDWYSMNDWKTASVRRWSHRFEAPFLP